MLLERYIYEVLNRMDSTSISNLARKLNEKRELLGNIVYDVGGDHFHPHYSDTNKLDSFISSCNVNLSEIGTGMLRKAYAIPNSEWVLKIGMGKYGFEANKGEIEISQGSYGSGARDIFIKIYEYDKAGSEPYWLICEKVVPLSNIDNLDILKTSFPTFWNMISEKDRPKIKLSTFKFILDGVFGRVAYRINQSSGSDSSKIFYDAINKKCTRLGLRCIDFEEVVLYKDFDRLCSAFAYISTNDFHMGNFGLNNIKNPGPESIVVLDFSVDWKFMQDKKNIYIEKI